MSDGTAKAEFAHRADTLEELAVAERNLQSARTNYEQAERNLVQSSERLLDAKHELSRLRDEVLKLYPDATPIDPVLEKAQETMDRFCAQLRRELAPAHSLDELRTAPGAVEESRDQLTAQQMTPDQILQTIATLNALDNPDRVSEAEQTSIAEFEAYAHYVKQHGGILPPLTDAEIAVADLDKLSTKATEEERAEPEIPEGFTRHDGGEWKGNPCDAVQVVFESGIISDISHTVEDEARFWHWPWDGKSDRIIAFNIVGPAPAEQPKQDADANFDAPNGETHYDEGEEAAARASEPDRGEPEPTTDLWSQGYNDKLNGFEPSLAEPDYLKGYADGQQILDARKAADEQAKFFAEGMMADADRHQSDQRSIVEKVFDAFKAKEPA